MSFFTPIKEDLLPRPLREGWHDSIRTLKKSCHVPIATVRRATKWVMQCSRNGKTEEECLCL